MTKLLKKLEAEAAAGYMEESVKPAAIIMLVLVLLIALPLVYLIRQINGEGALRADTTQYKLMAATVQEKVASLKATLGQEVMDENLLAGLEASPVVTLITPNVAPTNMDEAAKTQNNKLNVTLKFISWTPRNQLVNIDGRTYEVGEKVQGYTIVEIRKTEVVFESPLGETVIKYFYEYLDKQVLKK